jgi:hypothetical protein
MPKGMQAIYTQTIGSSVTTVTFNNIPQTYTDLLIRTSLRTDQTTASANYPNTAIFFNNNSGTGLMSVSHLYASGTGVGSDRESNTGYTTKYYSNMAATTANTFGNGEIFIPNYASTGFKQSIYESVEEDISTAASQRLIISLTASLFRSNAPITSISIAADATTAGVKFVAGSTFTLYGISK